MKSVKLAVTGLIGVIMGFVLYIAVAQLNPVLVDLLYQSDNGTQVVGDWPGAALIAEAGVLLLNIGAFIIGFVLPFIAVAKTTDEL